MFNNNDDNVCISWSSLWETEATLRSLNKKGCLYLFITEMELYNLFHKYILYHGILSCQNIYNIFFQFDLKYFIV